MIEELCANLKQHEDALWVLRGTTPQANDASIERAEVDLLRCERWLCLLGAKDEIERVRAHATKSPVIRPVQGADARSLVTRATKAAVELV